MLRTVYDFLTIDVTASGQVITAKMELNSNIDLVMGVQITGSKPNQVFNRGSQRIEVNGLEIFKEGFESKLLLDSFSDPDHRYFTIDDGIDPGNREVKITYKDTDNSIAPFDAYKVTLYIKCRLKNPLG